MNVMQRAETEGRKVKRNGTRQQGCCSIVLGDRRQSMASQHQPPIPSSASSLSSPSNACLTSKPTPSTPCPIDVYCDANWANDLDDRRSTSGCVVLLFGSSISWLSKKQTTVALSTAEAEYMAMSTSVQEVKWIKQLLSEMGCHIQLPNSVHTDNQAAQSMSRILICVIIMCVSVWRQAGCQSSGLARANNWRMYSRSHVAMVARLDWGQCLSLPFPLAEWGRLSPITSVVHI